MSTLRSVIAIFAAAMAIFFLAAVVTLAWAGDYDTDNPIRFAKRPVGRTLTCNVFGGDCRWETKYVRVPLHTHPNRPPVGYLPVRRLHPHTPPTPRGDLLSEGPRCVNTRVTAIGIEAYDKDKAKEQAQAALAEMVRARFGSRYMDVANGEAVVFECWRSATGNRQSEKVADFGGRELHQCQIESIPCRSKREVAASDDPKTEAMIEILERKGYDVRVQDPIPEKKSPRLLRRILPKREPQP